MPNPLLDKIDLFPICTRAHTARELAFAQALQTPLRTIRVLENSAAIVDAIIDSEGMGDVHAAYEGALKGCAEYKQWQNSMPYLKDVPQIRTYRRNKHGDLSAVNREVLKAGAYLPVGQIQYHGARFDSGRLHITDTPISTSMHPSVARWHAVEVGGQIAVLKIGTPRSVLGFVYKASGNQKLTHEYEVLLQSDLRLEESLRRRHAGIEVRCYDVYPRNA